MAAAIRQAVSIYLFWLLLFASFRPVFWYWQPILEQYAFRDFWRCFIQGLYMDASLAGYFSIIPLLFCVIRFGVSFSRFRKILSVYHTFWIPCFSLLYTVDLELFRMWGHRLDAAIVPYLQFPKEALASSLSAPLILLFTVWLLFTSAWILLWCKLSASFPENPGKTWLHTATSLFLTAACILPIRGGVQLAPMNQSSVYFSSSRPLNQTAENPVWVFIQSLLEHPQDELENLYGAGGSSDSKALLDSLYRDTGKTASALLLQNPNIILIIWESLTSKVSGCGGGVVPSTPNLDRLAKSGLFFERIYANGDRSEKGLVSILSAVPPFGKISLMYQPNLSAGFDFLSLRMKKLGYTSQYFYGGELEFANMKSYLLNAGYKKLTGKEDFPAESWNSKWGAHDEMLFNRQLKEAKDLKQPFFHTLFTLSSHEPFEVPGKTNPVGMAVDTLFCRAHRYTDFCLGNWVEKAQKESWWKNTLVIILADHGHTLPGSSGESDPEKFRIPMVWFGPALKLNGKISRLGSQTDLFATLCRQLGDSVKLPVFSKNLLSDGSRDFAYYTFRNGACLLDSAGLTPFIDSEKPNKASAFRHAVYQNVFKPQF